MCVQYFNETARGAYPLPDNAADAKQEINMLLVRDADSELKIADEFFNAGYYPEAAFHYSNYIAYLSEAKLNEIRKREDKLHYNKLDSKSVYDAHAEMHLENCNQFMLQNMYCEFSDLENDSRAEEQKAAEKENPAGQSAKPLELLARVSDDFLVPVKAERAGVKKSTLPKYAAASGYESANRCDKAIEAYLEILKEVRPNSPAEIDLHARIAILYAKRCDPKARGHFQKVLENIELLPLEFEARWIEIENGPRTVMRPIILSANNALQPAASDEDEKSVLVFRDIERLENCARIQPVPKFDGFKLNSLLTRRRNEILDAMRASLPEANRENAPLLAQIADAYIISGRFADAETLLDEIVPFLTGADAKFKWAACIVRNYLHFSSPSGRSFENTMNKINGYLESEKDERYRNMTEFLKARLLLAQGNRADASEIFGKLAGAADFEFAPDARLIRSILNRALLKIRVPELFTASGELPMEIMTRNVSEIRFEFYRVDAAAAVPSETDNEIETHIRKHLDELPVKDLKFAGEKTLPFYVKNFGQTDSFKYNLPIPGPGVYIVVATGGDVSVRFPAVRCDIRVSAARFPQSSVFRVTASYGSPVAGVKLFTCTAYLGTTDADGIAVSEKGGVSFSPYCDACGQYWTKCEPYQGRCREKYGTASPNDMGDIIVVGPGMLFKAKADTAGQVVAASEQSNPAKRVLLYVYADRPIYQAGDTMYFKGILRKEKEAVGRRASSRFDAAQGGTVQVEIKDGSTTLYSREFTTNEFGTFNGEFRIPKNAARKKYKMEIACNEAKETMEFEVRDFVKPDYTITFYPQKGGLKVFAGYAWGMPVPGAKITYLSGTVQKETALDDRGYVFIPAEDGKLVAVVFAKDGVELARKETTFVAPVDTGKDEKDAASASKPETGETASKADGQGDNGASSQPEPQFKIEKDKAVYNAGDAIKLTLHARGWRNWEAFVVLGDVCGYDAVHVESKFENAVVTFPACGSYDPAVYALAVFKNGDEEHAEKLKIPVCASYIKLKAEPDKQEYRPGETARVDISAMDGADRPLAADVSLAAVDEAIFTLAEDRTPDIYRFFYKERPCSCAFVNYDNCAFPGVEVCAESPLDLSAWRYFNVSAKSWQLLWGWRGTMFENLSNKNLYSNSCVDAYGIGGGAAGAYGSWDIPKGTTQYSIGGSPGTADCVVAQLRWFHLHQDQDGRWDCDGFSKNCKLGKCDGPGLPEYDVQVTSLQLLALLGNGHTHQVGEFKKTVRNALRFLKTEQWADGSLGRNGGKFWFWNHATATMALSEAYAITKDEKIKAMAENALKFLISAKNPGSGWGFEPEDGKPNTLMTGWAVLAMKAAKTGGLDVPKSHFDDARKFLDSVTDIRGWVYFEKIGVPDPDFLGNARNYDVVPEWTAVATLCRIFCGQKRSDANIQMALDIMSRDLPTYDAGYRKANYHYWYWGTYAMFQIGGEKWKRWNEAMKRALLLNQLRGGCGDGSWNPVDKWGKLYGRVGASGLAALSLEIYYRYARIHGGGADGGGEEETEIRMFFPDTAYWSPDIVTGPDGKAAVQFKLPDSITSLRFTARGITKDTAVGESTGWISIKKDFFVKLKTPQFFVSGDEAEIYAEIYNYTGLPRNADISLSGEGFACVSKSGVTVSVESGGMPKRATWKVKITSKKSVVFLAKARADAYSDAVQITAPVKVLGGEFIETVTKTVKPGEKFSVKLPKNAEMETASMQITVKPSKSSLCIVLDALKYLIDYPHG
jgi:hypothetical protein